MLQSLRNLRAPIWSHRRVVSVRWFSDDEKEEKLKKLKKKEEKQKPMKNKDANDRLNSLLGSMSTTSAKAEVPIPKPFKRAPKKVEPSDEDKVKEITGKIAKKMGGNVEETESVLLSKLLGIQDLKSPSGSLKDLISGLKIDDSDQKKKKPKRPQGRSDENEDYGSRAENVRKSMGRDRNFQRRPQKSESAPSSGVVDLFGRPPLGIFEKSSTAKDPLETWSRLQQRELKHAVTHPPNNYFEKMILWTEQGKVWQFPIDNEQGMEEEKSHDFSEHVLLEMFIEDWCPSSGPVRHFMELVCVGLSKNFHLTAQEKKAHLDWYRDYFNEKKDVLGDLLTLGKEGKDSQQKLDA